VSPEVAPPLFGASQRHEALQRLRAGQRFDLVVIGGGATGLGLALDAALRGLSVLLAEAGDFAEGTSSRATKLVHGGVRYLAQGQIPLVREALRERATLLANAPHLARPLPFIVPAYHRWELAWFGMGLKAYDVLAAAQGLGPTQWLSAHETRQRLPGVRAAGLQGGIGYWDGQFDDARLAVALARTAAAQGACMLNRVRVTGLCHTQGRVSGVRLRDLDPPQGGAPTPAELELEVGAGCVVNATGVWVDSVRALDRPSPDVDPVEPVVSPSQGVHLVVDRHFMPADHALMVPRTADGRVLFVVPWLGKLILGTTDTPRDRIEPEPRPLRAEVDFILGEAARYLQTPPTRADVRSAWVGLRPLVRPAGAAAAGQTQALSREHTVMVSPSGLVSVTGGKWTTYRAMAEDVLARCASRGLLPARPAGATRTHRLMGAGEGRPLWQAPGEHLYGAEAAVLRALPGVERVLWRDEESGQPLLTEAMVRFAARHEMALTVADVLARRSRALFLDARAAAALAAPVQDILAQEIGRTPAREEAVTAFQGLAAAYAQLPSSGCVSPQRT
jgi:glycerol-3-phosphate dehydrogenase